MWPERTNRSVSRLRELVQERMQSVKVVLDTLVDEAPVRQIVLRE
jgi:ribosomal protein L31E